MNKAPPRLITWPAPLPSSIEGLPEAVADLLGHGGSVAIDDLADLPAAQGRNGDAGALLLVIDPSGSGVAAPERGVDWLEGFDAADRLNLVVVAGDGFLGTDLPDRRAATSGAAAIAAVRSIAVTRGASSRANVVCVPEGLLGASGELRGPIRRPVELVDVAEGVSFFLSYENDYLNGQVLFVDCGRHLFSSATA